MDNSSLCFLFLKVLHLHVPNQRNHHCVSERSRYVLLIGLCWSSKVCIIHKWNTWSKPPSYRHFTHFHEYLLFIQTCDAWIAVCYHITEINWHLIYTWILWTFLQILKLEPPLLMASLFSLFHPTLSYLLRIGTDVYQVSCWCHLHICNVLSWTWSYYWKLYQKMSIIQRCCSTSMYIQAVFLKPWCKCHKQQLPIYTWHES